MRSSDVVVICLSRMSVTKEGYVQKEIRFALNVAEEKPEGTIFLIPVKFEECEIPERLRRRQWVNYFDIDGYDKLLKALTARARSHREHIALPMETEKSFPVLDLLSEDETGSEFMGIVGRSDPMKLVFEQARRAADTQTPVLIDGETGVGKELVAEAIHALGRGKGGPFIPVNCCGLLSVTNADVHRGDTFALFRDYFQRAQGGTLLCDEVEEMPSEWQTDLALAIRDSTFTSGQISAKGLLDVRVIAITNRNLRAAVTAGYFREDLFHFITACHITVPSLRERREDIPLLVRHFVRQLRGWHNKSFVEVPGRVMARLAAHDWPGNVRELRSVLEMAAIASAGPRLELLPHMLAKGH